MSLVNVAYRDTLTWSHPSLRSLEEQALVPMLGTSPIELGLQGHERRVYGIFATDPVYRPLFAAAFPGEERAGHDRQRGDRSVGVRAIDRVVQIAVRSLS